MYYHEDPAEPLLEVQVVDLEVERHPAAERGHSPDPDWYFPCSSCTNLALVIDLRARKNILRSAQRRGCLLSYSQAEPGRELTQPSPRLLAEPCTLTSYVDAPFQPLSSLELNSEGG